MRKKLLELAGFLRFIWRRWNEDRCPQVAGALTYATLLALVPVFVIVVAVLSSSPLFEDVIESLKRLLLRNLVPDIARHIIYVTLAQFQQNAARLTTVGLVGVVFVALMLLLFIDRTLNGIWRVTRSRPYWISVLSYVVLLLAGPLLIGVSVYATTYLSPLLPSLRGLQPEPHSPLLRVVPALVTSVAFFLVYRLLPHRRVPWMHALLGAVVAGVLFEAAKYVFSIYAHMAPTYNVVYGAFAAVPFFLVWIYLSWLTILLGAEITASAAYWEDGLWKHPPSPASHFRNAVRVARVLMEHAGAPVTFKDLRKATRLPVHELEDALLRMEACDIVAERGGTYRFSRPPEKVSIAELYEATVAPVGTTDPEEWAEVSGDFARAAREMREGLQRPLATLRQALSPSPQAGLRKRRGGRGRSARSAR
ncbi:MAG TPA: YihY family inner membrane protein [Usitatibacter sp.]|jgi:membrane protein|nr:YihY family inner membrane protein [Usitatibacter sp.]